MCLFSKNNQWATHLAGFNSQSWRNSGVEKTCSLINNAREAADGKWKPQQVARLWWSQWTSGKREFSSSGGDETIEENDSKIRIIQYCELQMAIAGRELPRSPSCTWPNTNSPPFFSWLTNRMSWQEERGLATISNTCGLQNFTWSFLTSSINRYLRT